MNDYKIGDIVYIEFCSEEGNNLNSFTGTVTNFGEDFLEVDNMKIENYQILHVWRR